jgi:hypothetical protein
VTWVRPATGAARTNLIRKRSVVQVHVAPPRSQGCDPRNAGPLAPRSVGFRRLRRPFWRCRSGTYEDGPSSPVAIRPAQDARARRFIAGHLVLLRSRFPGPPRCAGEGRLLTRLVTNVAALPARDGTPGTAAAFWPAVLHFSGTGQQERIWPFQGSSPWRARPGRLNHLPSYGSESRMSSCGHCSLRTRESC